MSVGKRVELEKKKNEETTLKRKNERFIPHELMTKMTTTTTASIWMCEKE